MKVWAIHQLPSTQQIRSKCTFREWIIKRASLWLWLCKLFSRVWLFVTPWTVALQALLSMEFSRQEYWSGLTFPSQQDLPNPGIKFRSPDLQTDLSHWLLIWATGKPTTVQSFPKTETIKSNGIHISRVFAVFAKVLHKCSTNLHFYQKLTFDLKYNG